MGAGQLAVIPGVPAAKSSFQATGDATAGVYIPMQNGGTTPGSEGSHSPRPRPAATARGHGGGGVPGRGSLYAASPGASLPAPQRHTRIPVRSTIAIIIIIIIIVINTPQFGVSPLQIRVPGAQSRRGGGVTPMPNIFKFVTGLLVRIPTNFSARFARRIPPTCHIVVH